MFLGDAHRESGVFSLCFALSPVESCSPPKLIELTLHVYAPHPSNASEETKKYATRVEACGNRQNCLVRSYLMNSVSRSWSRAMNDFVVR